MSEVSTAAPPAASGSGDVPLRRWLMKDPVRAAAYVMIAVAVLIRIQIAARGYLAEDDFVFVNRAAAEPLTVGFLFETFNNHLMPAGLLVLSGIAKAVGLQYWPYVLLFAIGQAALGVSFFRLLRLLVPPGWGQLIPLALLMFSPLTLDTTSMLTIGMFLLPMELAAVWAIGAQVKYVRTHHPRHLATLAAAVLFGLAFYEKALLVVPLVVLVTACLLVTGGPVRGLVRTVRQAWAAWLVLAGISAAYLWLYTSRPCNPVGCTPSLGVPKTSAGELASFLGDLVGTTLVPGLLGGPWQWFYTGDGPPLTDSPEVLRWLSWAVFLALVLGTILVREIAVRAWVLLLTYVAIIAVLFGATRLGTPLGELAGLVPHYVADVMVVGALCIGVALLGLTDVSATAESTKARTGVFREPAVFAGTVALGLIAVVAFGAGAATSAASFGDDWADKQGRDYVNTVRQELAKAPPGTVFFDQAVPDAVLAGYWWPNNLQSEFLGNLDPKPEFVTTAEEPHVIDPTGHIKPLSIQPARVAVPGPVKESDCGHRVSDGKPTLIPLEGDLFEWDWIVQIGYLSSGDSTATVRLGSASHQFGVRSGLHQMYVIAAKGEGSVVELTLGDPNVVLCTNLVVVGKVPDQP